MTFDLEPAAVARRDQATTLARDVVAPAADEADRAGVLPDDVRSSVRAVVSASGIERVVATEAVAAVSPAFALAAAGESLGATALSASMQWSGLRGLDVDGLAGALQDNADWRLAVSATVVGAASAAVQSGVDALKRAKAAGRADDAAQPLVADAATAVDASRLLLWDAAQQRADSDAAALGAALARMHALDAATLAWQAAERACGAEAFRPGTTLERLRRDALTVAQVLGDAPGAQAAVASFTLPA